MNGWLCSWRDAQFEVIKGECGSSVSRRFIAVGEAGGENNLSAIAELWLMHGPRAVESLHGSYAFAIWDEQERCLWLVRDRVGVETLYYTTTGASRFAGTRAELNGKTSSEIDLTALRDYLCCAFVPGKRTMRRDLHEVEPGTIVRIPGDDRTVYWKVEERPPREPSSIDDYAARVRTVLESAVAETLPRAEPVGVYLSGGLDSSCVVSIAARKHTAPVHTYSIHFGSECPNELEFSSLVAEHCSTEHHVIEISPDEMWELLPQTMAHLDDPIGDPLTVPNLILANAAKKDVSTILNGEGGDPCFGGPKNQPMLLNQLYEPSAPKNTGDELVSAYLASFQKCANDLPVLLLPEIWEQVRNTPSVFAGAFDTNGSFLNNLMFVNTRFKGADHILTKVNNLTRAAGLKGHSPLFDDRLVQLSLEIPPEYKLSGAEEKAVLKLAVADLLPRTILDRPKSGMMVPVQRWFREKWHSRAAGLLLSRGARTRRYLNPVTVREWLNYRGDTWARYGVKLWLLVSLELWLQANVQD